MRTRRSSRRSRGRGRAGTSYGAPTEAEVELAAEVVERVPGAEMVRLVSSGHRGRDDRGPPCARGDRARQGDQVRRRATTVTSTACSPRPARGSRRRASRPRRASRRAQAADTIVVPVERPRRRSTRRSSARATSSPPCSPSRSRPTWGWCRRSRASWSCCATRCDGAGALLVLDEVITGFRVARGGAQERLGVRAGPDRARQGARRRPAARRGRRAPRTLMEQLAPVGETYQAGTLSGNPLATAAGLATLRAARRRRLRAARGHDRAARGRPARRRPPRPASPVQVRARLRSPDRLLLGATRCATTTARAAADRDAFAALLRRDARARRLPAAVAVRGLVSVARARRRARRARRSRRPPESFEIAGVRVRDDGAQRTTPSARLRELVSRRGRGASPPALARPAGGGRVRPARARPRRADRADAGRVRARGREHPRGLPAALRRGRAARHRRTRTCACSPATTCTRSGSRGWRALGDLEAVRELADLITLCAQRHAGRAGGRQRPARAALWALWRAGGRRWAAGRGHEQARAAAARGPRGAAAELLAEVAAGPSEHRRRA